jgi:hypothetical protein
MRLKYSCGNCSPSYPYKLGTSYIADYDFELTDSQQSFSTNLFGSSNGFQNCGCDSENSTQSWILQIDNSAIGNSCTYNITTSTSCKHPYYF